MSLQSLIAALKLAAGSAQAPDSTPAAPAPHDHDALRSLVQTELATLVRDAQFAPASALHQVLAERIDVMNLEELVEEEVRDILDRRNIIEQACADFITQHVSAREIKHETTCAVANCVDAVVGDIVSETSVDAAMLNAVREYLGANPDAIDRAIERRLGALPGTCADYESRLAAIETRLSNIEAVFAALAEFVK